MRNKTEAFFVGCFVGIGLLATTFVIQGYLENDKIRAGDIVRRYNQKAGEHEEAIVISHGQMGGDEYYNVYPIERETWYLEDEKPNIRKVNRE